MASMVCTVDWRQCAEAESVHGMVRVWRVGVRALREFVDLLAS